MKGIEFKYKDGTFSNMKKALITIDNLIEEYYDIHTI